MATFKTLPTRKARRCMNCQAMIKAGEKYISGPAHPTYPNIPAAYCLPCADWVIKAVQK